MSAVLSGRFRSGGGHTVGPHCALGRRCARASRRAGRVGHRTWDTSRGTHHVGHVMWDTWRKRACKPGNSVPTSRGTFAILRRWDARQIQRLEVAEHLQGLGIDQVYAMIGNIDQTVGAQFCERAIEVRKA